jgi:hypothetical protein
MSLPPIDLAFIAERGLAHEIHQDAGALCLVLPAWPLPPGYSAPSSDLLIRLMPGYPDVAPDMWWFSPPALVPGRVIPGTDLTEGYLGRNWQRWSRHFQGGQWRSGVDGLESYLALIAGDLERWVPVPA